MSLRIGELARKSGLTVRTLHHYDAIGLLTPSGRSDAGYRLYDRKDVMRLHAIQALKSFGCSLAEIGQALSRGKPELPDILDRQVRALDAQARRAIALKDRLARLRERMRNKEGTDVDDWLEALGMLHVYRQYFSEEELMRLRQGRDKDAWRELAGRVDAAVSAGQEPDAAEARELVRDIIGQAGRTAEGDPVLLVKMRGLLDREERVRATVGFSQAALAWIDAAVAAYRRDCRPAVPSGTALGVATLRAAHQLLDDPPVFVDPLALAMVGPGREAVIRNDPARFAAGTLPGLRASVAVRARCVEDAWAAARARGLGQYVILGAGFDTFAYRTADRDSRIFEVDHPGTQAKKRQRLAEAGIAAPENLVFVPLDFERRTLAEALDAAGFRRDEPAFFSWPGVTMYLPEATVLETLAVLSVMVAGSEVLFDYAADPETLSEAERKGREAIMDRAAAGGEPWKSCFEPADLADRLARMGFVVIEDLGGAELTRRYLAGRSDGLRKSGVSRIVHVTIPRSS
ncbi:methyltransferase [Solidesulfovibrio fructosivorans JJ]]|uniref:Methyltransferase n=1 Tax=Solidesulfovibrio fructosivorans JJ] TaxID=596151 RepID=E1K055_SOLFR|nr:SAM-dependent methyltransferase [Solidesulfovibrio fructosivorans]EFL49973.1 methyltransferase [Solidesulfovibrio fructosivorans JJ]]